MSLHLRTLTLLLAGLAAPLGALAQADQAPPVTSPSQTSASGAAPSKAVPSSAQSEAGEPRANTSAAAPEAAAEGQAPRSRLRRLRHDLLRPTRRGAPPPARARLRGPPRAASPRPRTGWNWALRP